MANRYWVGNGGNWNNTAHWSATSGGTGGASLPTSADNVYFDANSFTATGQIVTINVQANCLDMDWTGATNNPTLAGGSTLNIYGNITLISAMSVAKTLVLKASTTGKTITTNGLNFPLNSGLVFSGTSGGWILQDNIVGIGDITHTYGVLDTNNNTISCKNFSCTGTNTRTLNLGSSVITCSGDISFALTGLTMTADTSKFIMIGNSRGLYGGGLTYNNVEFQGTPITITGSNTFNKLTVASGKVLSLTAGTTQTITSLLADGATIQSATAGTPANISKSSGELIVNNASIKDIAVIGDSTFIAKSCNDLGGNTGWIWWGWQISVVDRVEPVKYDKTDLNRVEMNISYLAELLNEYGYNVSVSTKLNWGAGDIPTQSQMSKFLTDLQALEDAYYTLTSTPAAPESMAKLFWYDANNIEQILLDINTLLENMIAQFKFSDTFYCGEV